MKNASVWHSVFNLNLSSPLTAINACTLLYGLLTYWQYEKAPLKDAIDSLMTSHLTNSYVTHYKPAAIFPKTLQWDEQFTSADMCQDMVITCTLKLTHWASPILSSTLDMPQQELSKLSSCQTATYYVHITSARPSCSLWFILPGWGWQRPCGECFRLNNPPEEALKAVFSLVAYTAVAVEQKLADTLNAPRSHWLRTEKDSSEAISEEMGFLDSINEEKMVEGERWSISCATEQ